MLFKGNLLGSILLAFARLGRTIGQFRLGHVEGEERELLQLSSSATHNGEHIYFSIRNVVAVVMSIRPIVEWNLAVLRDVAVSGRLDDTGKTEACEREKNIICLRLVESMQLYRV